MPRERITAAGSTDPFDVVVAWNRDGTVQVATTAEDADERLRNWTEAVAGNGGPVITGSGDGVEVVAKTRESKPGSSFRLFDGWHTSLDRQAVNKLIRVLRAARDQAFGKDE